MNLITYPRFRNLIVFLVALSGLFFSFSVRAQSLLPGYSPTELADILMVSVRTGSGSSYYSDSNYVAASSRFQRAYRSPEMGLLNLWELWTDNRNTAIISVRGTLPNPDSWLSNFYSAMIPAKGDIILPGNDTVAYQVADHPQAAVHVGWMISTAYLGRDILPRLDSLYKKGYRNLMITGHSQGGGISYLLTAHLRQWQKQQKIASDWQIKTYSTAAPKPGNVYFAYDYEAATRGGWAFNVVNSIDWVPEMPISVQTVGDFNQINPFTNAKDIIGKQKFPTNWALRYMYNRLDKPTRRAEKNFEKYLGKIMGKRVTEKLVGLQVPPFVHTINYARVGETIVLRPDADYYARFPNNPDKIFVNHFHQPYIYLLNKSLLDSTSIHSASGTNK